MPIGDDEPRKECAAIKVDDPRQPATVRQHRRLFADALDPAGPDSDSLRHVILTTHREDRTAA